MQRELGKEPKPIIKYKTISLCQNVAKRSRWTREQKSVTTGVNDFTFILASILNREKSVALGSRTRWIIFIVGNSVIKCSNFVGQPTIKHIIKFLMLFLSTDFYFRLYNTFLDAGEDIFRNWTKVKKIIRLWASGRYVAQTTCCHVSCS
jgi:hypothetical protein